MNAEIFQCFTLKHIVFNGMDSAEPCRKPHAEDVAKTLSKIRKCKDQLYSYDQLHSYATSYSSYSSAKKQDVSLCVGYDVDLTQNYKWAFSPPPPHLHYNL